MSLKCAFYYDLWTYEFRNLENTILFNTEHLISDSSIILLKINNKSKIELAK